MLCDVICLRWLSLIVVFRVVRSVCYAVYLFFFFFQAEDGIRDLIVTGVQTCALPISVSHSRFQARMTICLPGSESERPLAAFLGLANPEGIVSLNILPGKGLAKTEIGRASCRERV